MVHLFVEIRGPIDSRELWDELEPYGVNVTDMSDTVLVYADLPIIEAVTVVGICSKYGSTKSQIERA